VDLGDGSSDIGGQRVGHGLDGDRRITADGHRPDMDLARLPPFDVLIRPITGRRPG
jgi:hypothetical protein